MSSHCSLFYKKKCQYILKTSYRWNESFFLLKYAGFCNCFSVLRRKREMSFHPWLICDVMSDCWLTASWQPPGRSGPWLVCPGVILFITTMSLCKLDVFACVRPLWPPVPGWQMAHQWVWAGSCHMASWARGRRRSRLSDTFKIVTLKLLLPGLTRGGRSQPKPAGQSRTVGTNHGRKELFH